mmetsp:Transcript_33352/g.53410  ORF Transcript_33352/g.53410 Transcript_33352/m.53410 type:complete len:321 (-) Transcript_33352:93-1055(-)
MPDDVKLACWKCLTSPAPGIKFRLCGGCGMAAYCGKECAKADWPEHKLECQEQRQMAGGAKDALKKSHRNYLSMSDWFAQVPGLFAEIEHLAWNHRAESPFIQAKTSKCDVDGSRTRVTMTPRSIWETDPRFSSCRKDIAQSFDEAAFRPDKMYVCELSKTPGQKIHSTMMFTEQEIRGAVIVEALTSRVKAQDLADAFAWFESMLPEQDAHKKLQFIRQRARSLHGCTAPQGSVPVPTRALNTEVAYMMMDTVDIAFVIRLTGLFSATHLNDREGVICGGDPADTERWTARFDDGNCALLLSYVFKSRQSQGTVVHFQV